MGLAIHLEGICSSIKAAPSKAAPSKAPSWERAMITSALPLCGPHLGWPQPSARWTPLSCVRPVEGLSLFTAALRDSHRGPMQLQK